MKVDRVGLFGVGLGQSLVRGGGGRLGGCCEWLNFKLNHFSLRK